jgi:hypothetical protein
MSKRYSIRAHRYCERGVTEICQCGSNPQEIVAAIRRRRITIGFTPKGHPIRINEFERIHIIDHGELPLAAPSFAQPREETAGNAGTVEGIK